MTENLSLSQINGLKQELSQLGATIGNPFANVTAGSAMMPNHIIKRYDAEARKSYRETRLTIREVENGKLVILGERAYIVPPGESLISVVGQALVEAKLEE